MKVVIASNPFKGSLSGIEVADRIAAGFKSGMGRVSVDKVPIADGGDGTLDAVASSVKSERIFKRVRYPLGNSGKADYLLVDGGKTGVVEMARASGLALLKDSERDPVKATTFGTGQLIKDALDRGVKRIIVGIGGSATNDGGMGIAAALGCRFLDSKGKPVAPCGGGLSRVARIDMGKRHPGVAGVEILVASDVTNPLLGENGAAAVYSPQKGASPAQVRQLDAGLEHLADVVLADLGKDLRDYPGAGAAGGTGYGLMTFLEARLQSGIDLMIDITQLEKRVKAADLVVTGEGFMDSQSAQGKAPYGVLKLAKKYKKPVIAFCGGLVEEDSLNRAGFTAVFPIVDKPMALDRAIAEGGPLLEAAARRAARLIKAFM
ncbi:MAG TPA: glycerate kinase [bacterium]|nr:glycerate kinase [bacterium]